MAVGLFAILDDVAVLLDDVASMSRVAAKNTAGILGDDLAVNVEKATGFHASRELPVIWAITKGSFLNKLIILPVAFLLSAFLPWVIVPILLIGGAYLCYEGAETIYEVLAGHESEQVAARDSADAAEIVAREAAKISAAIRTDFILSIEIVVITLGTVVDASIGMQITVVSLIALLATVGVYGLVALLVRLDDAGLYLLDLSATRVGLLSTCLARCGQGLVDLLPPLIRLLGVVGTVAMLLVGGGLYVHNIAAIHHALIVLPGLAANLVTGLVLGGLLVLLGQIIKKMRSKNAGFL